MDLLRLSNGSSCVLNCSSGSKPPSKGICSLHRRISQASHAAFSFFLSSSFTGSSGAVEYEDIIRGSSGAASPIDAASAISPSDGLDFSVDSGVVQSALDFLSDNPVAIAGGAFVVGLPIILSRLLGQKQAFGTVSAKEAYEKLASKEPAIQILDIRELSDIKTEGTPDLRELKKRVLQISFSQQDGDAFVSKVKRKIKDPASTTLYILDRFDGNSLAAAKLLTSNGFKEAYAIKDGAEGGRGWKQSGLAWLEPRKGFSFNLDAFKDVQLESDIVPVTLGAAAAAGVGLVVFSEAETALQLLGTVALLQIFAKKFLFAEDRKKTIKEIQTFLDTKVAPKELVDEIKGVGKALLPKYEEVATSIESAGNGAIASDEVQAPPEKEVAPEPVKAEASPAAPGGKPQSPYSQYEDLKPPSSPTPSPPVFDDKPSPAAPIKDENPSSSPVKEDKPEENQPQTSTRPLSPYNMYPDLKPPSSPTPSRP